MEDYVMLEPEITLKNTKAEILEALNNALKRNEMLEKGKLNPEKTEKENMQRKAVETTKKAIEQNVFSKELNDKFGDLEIAIAAEENRLQELYGIGKELQKLALVLEAGKERTAEIEDIQNIKISDAESKLKQLKIEFEHKNAELTAEYDVSVKKLKLERSREEEEYKYNLARIREKENNSWEDEKAAREAKLLKNEEQASILLKDAQSKAEYIRTLESKVDGIW
jgi:hypothetical protein